MERFNLWLTIDDHSKVICHGEHDEMNDLALQAFSGIDATVHVLPDTEEPTTVAQ